MGLAVIPDDWEEGYVELCVLWPNSTDWRAILRGLLTLPYEANFWDKFTGTISDAQAAIIATFDQNLHLEECMIIPPGTCAMFAGPIAPIGWLVRNGATISRTTYAALFAAIGDRWGGGDGSTTFQLPNALGRVDAGQDASQSNFQFIGQVGGVVSVGLSVNQMPSHNHVQNPHSHTQTAHNHTQTAHSHADDRQATSGAAWGPNSTLAYALGDLATEYNALSKTNATPAIQNATPAIQDATPTNQATGGAEGHTNLQPYGVYLPIIKV